MVLVLDFLIVSIVGKVEYKAFSFELLIPCFAIAPTMEIYFRWSVEVTHVVCALFGLRMPVFI